MNENKFLSDFLLTLEIKPKGFDQHPIRFNLVAVTIKKICLAFFFIVCSIFFFTIKRTSIQNRTIIRYKKIAGTWTT